MVLKIIWRKFRLYKRFQLDIWGKRFTSLKTNTQTLKLFNLWVLRKKMRKNFYKTRYIFKLNVKKLHYFKRIKNRFITGYKLSRLFYLTLSYPQFRKLAARASRDEGSWESSLIMLIENRLISILYRMQINMNIFELRWLVYRRKILVNNKIVDYTNAAVDYFSVVRPIPNMSERFRFNITGRFSRYLMYFNVPRYLFVNYKFLFAFVFKEPKKADLIFPVKSIDVYRGTNFY